MSSSPFVKYTTDCKFFQGPDAKQDSDPFKFAPSRHYHRTSFVLQSIFVEVLQSFWARSGEFQFIDTVDSSIKWEGVTAKSKLEIAPEYSFSDQHKEAPCLIGVSILPQTLVTTPGGTRDGTTALSDDTAEKQYSRKTAGIARLSHVGTSPELSIAMADETQEFFTVFSPVLRKELEFSKLEVTGRSTLSERPRRYYGIPRHSSDVDITFEFETTWSLILESRKLRSILFSAGQPLQGRSIITTT